MLLLTLVFETSEHLLKLLNFIVFQIFELQKGATLNISPLNFPTSSPLVFISASGFNLPTRLQKFSVTNGLKLHES